MAAVMPEERTLPANLEAERAVLGAILLEPELIYEAGAILTPDSFMRDAHRRIFRVFVTMAASQPATRIDFVTVREHLERLGELESVGGPAYLAALVDGVPRRSNVQGYAAIVREKAILRQVIFTANKATQQAYEADEDGAQVLDQAIASLLAVGIEDKTPFQRVGSSIQETYERFEMLHQPTSGVLGEKTGLPSLDRLIRGLRPGCLILIAGRPGTGKSALGMNIAVQVAKGDKSVGFFSLEMTHAELMDRLFCTEARLDIDRLTNQRMEDSDWKALAEATERLAPLPLFVKESPSLTLFELRSHARQLQRDAGKLSLLIVDYVQLMEPPKSIGKKWENRTQEVGQLSRGLKRLAVDLSVPVIAISQLSRASDQRQDGRPQLSDLRESGSLEQDADVVILIYHPDEFPQKKGAFRKQRTKDVIQQEIEKGVTELIVAKHRGGPTGIARCMWRKEFTKFEPLAL